MDEDEEVDIIGNYDDISKLLSCDYTVHPNWGNENSDGNFWSDSVPKHENLESNVQVLQSEEVIIEQPQPVPKLMVFEWMNNEEELIFEDDIPASIEEVVEDTVSSPTTNCSESCNNFDDWGELGAFETHPPAKNSKYIGPTNPRSLLKVKIESPGEFNCVSLAQNCTNNGKASTGERPVRKFKQTLTVNTRILQKKIKPTTSDQTKISDTGKSKFWQKIKMRASNLKNQRLGLKIRAPSKMRKSKRRLNQKKGDFESFGENITTNHGSDPKSVQFVSTETVVKLKNYESESDVEIDVVADITNEDQSITLPMPKENSPPFIEREKAESENNVSVKQDNVLTAVTFKDISEKLKNSLEDITIPTEELHIDSCEILELEKYVHSEFFENRITKTPEQYLRIRNHILCVWQSLKPNYVSKTAVRSGLKQAGDVNSISRIHRLLEQIGAINFGHQEVHFEFIRPLSDFVATLTQPSKNRSNSNSSFHFACPINMEKRQRVRMNTAVVDSKADNALNYTISHIQGVVRPSPPALNSQKNKFRANNKQVMSDLDLVKCLKFSKDILSPFKVSITLSTLLCLHLHALSSDHEIMGFLGGHRSKYVGRNKISLTRYKPCRTSHQSGTTCEMCPVSQLEQSSILTNEGYELLGWFHSHPLFPANPSRTDVRTQRVMQQQFNSGNDRPLIGVILSCLNMSLKCMYIMPKDLHTEPSDSDLPYELDIDIIKDCTDFKNDVKDVLSMIAINNDCDSILDIIEKFKSTSNTLLSQFGFKTEQFFKDVFF